MKQRQFRNRELQREFQRYHPDFDHISERSIESEAGSHSLEAQEAGQPSPIAHLQQSARRSLTTSGEIVSSPVSVPQIYPQAPAQSASALLANGASGGDARQRAARHAAAQASNGWDAPPPPVGIMYPADAVPATPVAPARLANRAKIHPQAPMPAPTQAPRTVVTYAGVLRGATAVPQSPGPQQTPRTPIRRNGRASPKSRTPSTNPSSGKTGARV